MNNNLIAKSNGGYIILNFFVWVFLSQIALFLFLIQKVGFSDYEIVLICFLTFIVVTLAFAYYNFKGVEFYREHICIKYFIKHDNLLIRTISIKDIIAFRYIFRDTPHGAGLGVLKIYYKYNEHNKTIRCKLNKEKALILCSIMNDQGITVEIDTNS